MRRLLQMSLRHHVLVAILAVVTFCTLALTQTAQIGRASSGDRATAAVESAPRSLERSFWSDALGRAMPYEVYLPPGYYSNPDRRYPVLYMLHGLGGDYRSWQADGLFSQATAMIEAGEIESMIIVTPNGERGYWVDHANNGPRFGSYIAKDLVSTIDAEYRTITTREARAIGGMSMGGHGALQLALNNPGEFGIVGAHSVALRRFGQAFDFFGDRQYFEAHDPVSICLKNPVQASKFQIWLDIGDKDAWYPAAKLFHEQLQSYGVPHQWNVSSGDHNDAYWTAHIADYLRFYSNAFGKSSSALLTAA